MGKKCRNFAVGGGQLKQKRSLTKRPNFKYVSLASCLPTAQEVGNESSAAILEFNNNNYSSDAM